MFRSSMYWCFLNNSYVLVTCDTTYNTDLVNNNDRVRNLQCSVSTGHTHPTLNETGFQSQLVSSTNVVGCYMKQRVSGRQGSLDLSFPSFFFWREEPLLAGNYSSPYNDSKTPSLDSAHNCLFKFFLNIVTFIYFF